MDEEEDASRLPLSKAARRSAMEGIDLKEYKNG
jgi:hypothetical protein